MTFRKNIPALLWAFSPIFLLCGASMTSVFIRDGAPFGYSPTMITVQSDSHVSMTWRFPFRKEERMVARADIASAAVFESTDDESARYFHARVPLQDGTMRDMTEGHHRESCEATCIRFNAILWQRSTEGTA